MQVPESQLAANREVRMAVPAGTRSNPRVVSQLLLLGPICSRSPVLNLGEADDRFAYPEFAVTEEHRRKLALKDTVEATRTRGRSLERDQHLHLEQLASG